jgi:predicted anti-sigma-YlaC factor YlaD
MKCAELEILLADYLDGAVSGVEKSAVQTHLAGCASCAELARDAAGAVAFMERAATVEPPPGMIARILLDGRTRVKRSWAERLLGFVSQPRLAMSVAMAVLSIAMLDRMWGPAESQVHRAWDRTVKQYESLPLVSEIQSRLEDWTQDAGLNGALDQ